MRSAWQVVRAGVVAAGLVAAAAPAAWAQSWAGVLTAAQQVPANASTASGFSIITLSGNLLRVQVDWTGITGGPLAAGHIHCCTVGSAVGQNAAVAVPFPGLAATTAGSYDNTFDLLLASNYTGAFIAASGGTTAGARAALIAGLNSGQAYVNLHNAVYPGGEIRANVATVPEPGTYALVGAGLTGLGMAARRRRRVYPRV